MLALYNKDFTTKYGTINTTVEAFVEEERNGLFELSFIMLNTDSLFNYVKEDNIVVANANNTLLNQKFRIYMTRKLMNNRVEVFARHISFDLMYDYIDSINFENQSCEYALNMLFRNSNFSKHYKGYSDIINAQDYSMSMANILEAIGGKQGSVLDTFGTGAELLRDNENIHVLNKRGHDNSVSIEYKKSLTGFELEEDTTELITRILPYAKYTPQDEEGNSLEEVIIKASYVDSPLIANYSHPFIKAVDYSDKFDDENIPTVDKLRALAELEYKNNKVDTPKQNFKIEFIPLSKCVGYEGLKDNISLCDTVTILDTRYNINTQAKVIKVTYNVLKNRYESMELGEPKTSLGDIVGGNSGEASKGEQGPPGPQGPPGADGDIGDFPNSLPSTPVVTTKVYGFANIEISWTFDNKVYYQYEVYASKEANFTPNAFNLIHKGQTSTYMYQAKPNETWHFKVCCINSHGERTNFGYAYATTTKVDDLSNYVSEMAIDEALIGTLSLDRGWFGSLKGNYINAKNLSVTDGNGKRTLDIDSFGNVNLNVTSFKIANKQVYTSEEADNAIVEAIKDVRANILPNGSFNEGSSGWSKVNNVLMTTPSFYNNERIWCNFYSPESSGERYAENIFDILPNKVYNFSMLIAQYSSSKTFYRIRIETKNTNSSTWNTVKEFTGNTVATRSKPEQLSYSFETTSNVEKCRVWIGKLDGEVFDIYVSDLFMGTGIIYARKSEFEILDTKISSKVSENDFGTLVEQNAYAVKIAWNNNSKYVQFENGGLAIYNGSISSSQKRAFFDEKGIHLWRDNYYLGKLGSNQYSGDSSLKGVVFDLEYQGAYTTWAARDSSSSSAYTMRWTYCNKTVGGYTYGKLHAGCDIDMHNYYLRNVKFEGGGINGTLVFTQIVSMNSNGTASRWYNNSKLVFQNGILVDATWGNV